MSHLEADGPEPWDLVEIVASARAQAVWQERSRLAREIHDGIAQLFVGIARHLEHSPHACDEMVKRARSLAANGLEEARCIVQALDARQLRAVALVEGLRELAQAMVAAPMHLEFTADEPCPRLPGHAQAHAFRIVQEAIGNAVKHSAAQVLRVEISCSRAGLGILVADDGRGFAEYDEQHASGCGMLNMRARAQAIGAQLHVASGVGSGTRILLEIPATAAV
jgi:NarL family two-component system sensor histidine kinase LiaS